MFSVSPADTVEVHLSDMSDSEEDSQDKQLKIVVIGDGACGKVRPSHRTQKPLNSHIHNVTKKTKVFPMLHISPPTPSHDGSVNHQAALYAASSRCTVFPVTMTTDAIVVKLAIS